MMTIDRQYVYLSNVAFFKHSKWYFFRNEKNAVVTDTASCCSSAFEKTQFFKLNKLRFTIFYVLVK